MTVAAPTKTYPCFRCGKRQRPERQVFSKHTRRRYCRDIAACDRRSKRRKP